MKKARCFVSYCVDDIEPNHVKSIVDKLERIADKGNYFIEFLFDRNLKIGEDLNQFMSEISTADSVVMFVVQNIKKGARMKN